VSEPAGGASLDRPGPVRPGEEIDRTRLASFLAGEMGLDGDPEVEQFASGYSNLTYLVRAGGREMVLRRPPVGSKVKSAHDMGREHQMLERLHPVYPLAPRPLAACADPAVLGFPFYLMERVTGVVLRARLPGGVELPPALAAGVARSLVKALVALHAVDWRAAGIAGHPEGYTARQVRGWAERWRGSQTDDIPALDAVAGWLATHLPGEAGATVVHNDYKHDNLVLDPTDLTRIQAVLDWEMATVGDPLLDLGTTLGYWVEAGDPEPLRRLAFGPTHLPGNPSRRELADLYAAASGRDLARLPFYYAFGLFKIAVIAQQIYYRWKQGLTRDPRFAGLLPAIRTLGEQAAQTIERDTI
jgi:aminoglycoside phosphotransferase (APT) family kinase protein